MTTTIAVFSDTHGDISRFYRIKPQLPKVDAVFHLGDYGADAADIGLALNAPVYAVQGNCDSFFCPSPDMPFERVVTLGGIRFYLTHGHLCRGDYRLLLTAEQARCACILYGHTHRQSMTSEKGILILNPGSLSHPRDGNIGYALLSIEDGDLSAKLCSL